MRKVIWLCAILVVSHWGYTEEEPNQMVKDVWTAWDEESNTTITKEACIPGEECDNCEISGDASLDCVHLKIPVGRKNPGTMLNSGYIMLMAQNPTATMYTPQALKYVKDFHITGLYNQLTEGAYGHINMTDPYGSTIRFDFNSGSSIGVPMGGQYYSNLRLMMVDAEGWAVTNSPAYYDLYQGNGDLYRFCAATSSVDYLDLILQKTPSGREEHYDDLGYEIIKDEDHILKQIKTPSDLADIQVDTETSYSIKLYRSYQLESGTDTNGYYVPHDGEEALTTWVIENPGETVKDLTARRIINANGVKSTNVYEFVYADAANEWQLRNNGSDIVNIKNETWDDLKTQLLVTSTVGDNLGKIDKKEQRLYYMYPWGGARIQEIIGSGSNTLTTYSTYYTSSVQTGKYGNVASKVMPDGSWRIYDYDTSGRKTEEKTSWKDAAFGAAVGQTKVKYYSYTPVASGDSLLFNDQRPRTITEQILGETVSREYRAYVTNSVKELAEIVEKCSDTSSAYGDTSNMRTITVYYGTNTSSHQIGRIKTVEYPDGRLDNYSYEFGNYYPSNASPEDSWFEVDVDVHEV